MGLKTSKKGGISAQAQLFMNPVIFLFHKSNYYSQTCEKLKQTFLKIYDYIWILGLFRRADNSVAVHTNGTKKTAWYKVNTCGYWAGEVF